MALGEDVGFSLPIPVTVGPSGSAADPGPANNIGQSIFDTLGPAIIGFGQKALEAGGDRLAQAISGVSEADERRRLDGAQRAQASTPPVLLDTQDIVKSIGTAAIVLAAVLLAVKMFR